MSRVDPHIPISKLFLPPNKHNENASSVYSITAWGLCWGSICFPRSQKGPRFSLMKPESADTEQYADFLNARDVAPFRAPLIYHLSLSGAGCPLQHRKTSKSVAPVERINVFWEQHCQMWMETDCLTHSSSPSANAITPKKLHFDFMPWIPQITHALSLCTDHSTV